MREDSGVARRERGQKLYIGGELQARRQAAGGRTATRSGWINRSTRTFSRQCRPLADWHASRLAPCGWRRNRLGPNHAEHKGSSIRAWRQDTSATLTCMLPADVRYTPRATRPSKLPLPARTHARNGSAMRPVGRDAPRSAWPLGPLCTNLKPSPQGTVRDREKNFASCGCVAQPSEAPHAPGSSKHTRLTSDFR